MLRRILRSFFRRKITVIVFLGFIFTTVSKNMGSIEPFLSQFMQKTSNDYNHALDTEKSDELTTLDYTGTPYKIINKNNPYFTKKQKKKKKPFEKYAKLDSLGRCGVAFALCGKELMPTEKRGEIGSVKPSGWQTKKYPSVITDKYLYNRCHLIAYMLTGENANKRNLITGTRYLNVEGMLPFETQVCDYIKKTGNHVLYRVTPAFEDDNLIAEGVLMEAYSIEDNGKGIKFCVFCYNVQPHICINYQNGDSRLLK